MFHCIQAQIYTNHMFCPVRQLLYACTCTCTYLHSKTSHATDEDSGPCHLVHRTVSQNIALTTARTRTHTHTHTHYKACIQMHTQLQHCTAVGRCALIRVSNLYSESSISILSSPISHSLAALRTLLLIHALPNSPRLNDGASLNARPLIDSASLIHCNYVIGGG